MPEPPSVIVSAGRDSRTANSSSSAIPTVTDAACPTTTPSGRSGRPNRMLSRSSSTASSTAVSMNVCRAVSGSKVSDSGIAPKSAADAPPPNCRSIPISTLRSGARFSDTETSTLPPSGTRGPDAEIEANNRSPSSSRIVTVPHCRSVPSSKMPYRRKPTQTPMVSSGSLR